MGTKFPKDLQLNPLGRALTNRRDFLKKTGTIAGFTTASAFISRGVAAAPSPPTATPDNYDLRAVSGSNFITDPRDQGNCNSCTAFAVIAAIEGAISVKNNIPNPNIHLSEEQLFECAGPGCDTNAWYPDGALEYCKNTGVASYLDYGAPSGTCRTDTSWSLQKISGYVGLRDAQAMKEWISGTGPNDQASPVISLFVLYQDLWEWNPNSVNQVYKHNGNSAHNEVRLGGHAVCVVGYKDNPGYWICKNSWNQQWGGAGKGFFNIAYGDCHIDDFRMYGVVL